MVSWSPCCVQQSTHVHLHSVLLWRLGNGTNFFTTPQKTVWQSYCPTFCHSLDMHSQKCISAHILRSQKVASLLRPILAHISSSARLVQQAMHSSLRYEGLVQRHSSLGITQYQQQAGGRPWSGPECKQWFWSSEAVGRPASQTQITPQSLSRTRAHFPAKLLLFWRATTDRGGK